MYKKCFATCVIGMAVALGACASGARSEQIASLAAVGKGFGADHQLRNAMNIARVEGVSDTSTLLVSGIPIEQFNAGLERSLRTTGLLAESPARARYSVAAILQDVRRPVAGPDVTVTIAVRYIVTPVGSEGPIFNEVVSTSGVGPMNNALGDAGRLRIANERAARENIAVFLRRLRERVPAASVTPIS